MSDDSLDVISMGHFQILWANDAGAWGKMNPALRERDAHFLFTGVCVVGRTLLLYDKGQSAKNMYLSFFLR